ncbi:MAG: SEC-C domain-containing protein [Candidatus Gastranaerophilales bacterium]|nr:SEC-C domain-containing protein [Candidatus Gastranaerophilales bacterium]
MPSVVDSLNLISSTMENILDFVANDETLSNDFQQYLEANNIEIETERDFNNIIIQYMLDMKMQNGLRVLEYYRRNSKSYDEIIDALQNSFCSVFKVDKILSNAYEVTCLTSGANLTLIPMVKMTHLKQVGRYDYIQARILELDNVQYILEIYDVISEYNPYSATVQAIRYMLLNPKSAYFKNEGKKEVIEKSIEDFNTKFREYFGCDFIVTTNKKVDLLIEAFNKYRENSQKIDYKELIEEVEEYRYLNIDEFNCDDETFMQNAIGGFSSHKEIYDVGLWMDSKRGLYIIPFLNTFFNCFTKEPTGKIECIKEFLTSDKIPPSVLKYAQNKYDNFFEVINSVLNTKFETLEEVLFNTKTAFIDSGVFSPVSVLFNSELFSQLIGLKDEKKPENKNIGRNEPCPCGSGLKYKNCCGKN